MGNGDVIMTPHEKTPYLNGDLLPAHELGVSLGQPDAALQQPHCCPRLHIITVAFYHVPLRPFCLDCE